MPDIQLLTTPGLTRDQIAQGLSVVRVAHDMRGLRITNISAGNDTPASIRPGGLFDFNTGGIILRYDSNPLPVVGRNWPVAIQERK